MQFIKHSWFPLFVFFSCWIIWGKYSKTRDFPVVTSKETQGVILDTDKSYDGYYLNYCNLFDKNTLILELGGKYCGFLSENQFVSLQDSHLRMLNEEKSILWSVEVAGHHDISLDTDRKEIAIITTKPDGKYGITHGVKVFNEHGVEVFSWDTDMSLRELNAIFDRDIDYLFKYENNVVNPKDPVQSFMKINSVQIVPPTPLYPELDYLKPGNILINLQHQLTFVILDRETKRVVWHLRTKGGCHAAKITKEGKLSYFHNKTAKKYSHWTNFIKLSSFYPTAYMDKEKGLMIEHEPGKVDGLYYSYVREYDFKKDIHSWAYYYPNYFYSGFLGYAQPLPNGNVLVSHITRGGSAFEVTKENQIVWEWVNPQWDEVVNVPKSVYQVLKVDKKMAENFLKEAF